MKLPLGWLAEFVDIGADTAALCEVLTMGGLEVDAVEERSQGLAGVVVGKIVAIEPHPNGDRLQVCRVDAGAGDPLSVVCGAANARRGLRVAFARDGATLPNGARIGTTEVRGVSSAGMLCSEAELGLADQSDGILELPGKAPIGKDVSEYLGARDTIVELSITPNRGDCLSILGLAREVALLTGVRLRTHRPKVKEKGAAAAAEVSVRIDEAGACRRYAARVIRGVAVGASPMWVRLRLEAAGMRSVNNIVDATNYVMLERGQPLHAFDLAKLQQREIVVRRAGSTDAMQTLDGMVRALVSDDLLITTGDEALAIAGVMGGADSEVTDATTDLLLESAWFDPSSVRQTSKRLDLKSEAAYRFERSVDVEGVVDALDAVAALIATLAGGEIAPGVVDCYPGRREAEPITLRPERVSALLGTEIARSEVRRSVKALGAKVEKADGGALAVYPPTFRSDLVREIDLIEEVARVHGYGEIPTRMPVKQIASGEVPLRMQLAQRIRTVLQGLGFSELVGLAFASEQRNQLFPGTNTTGRGTRLLNPIASDEPELRRSLLTSVVAMWRLNRNQGAGAIAGYSIGKVYWHDGESREGWRVAGVLAGQMPTLGLGTRRPPDFGDAKGVLEQVFEELHVVDRISWVTESTLDSFHPGKTACVHIDGRPVGILGALHPEAEVTLDLDGAHWLFEIDLDAVVKLEVPPLRYAGLPRYPSVVRDLALVVDGDFHSGEISRFVCNWNPDLVEDVYLFDEYVGSPIAPGQKSLAYSIAFRAVDRTLTDEEVNGLQEQLMAALEQEYSVKQR